MTHRERVRAILNYAPYDRMPLVHFGFWAETLEKWAAEGHITKEEAESWGDGDAVPDPQLDLRQQASVPRALNDARTKGK